MEKADFVLGDDVAKAFKTVICLALAVSLSIPMSAFSSVAFADTFAADSAQTEDVVVDPEDEKVGQAQDEASGDIETESSDSEGNEGEDVADEESLERTENESLFTLAGAVSAEVSVPAPVLTLRSASGASSVSVAPQKASGQTYYFLPSGVQLDSVALQFDDQLTPVIELHDAAGGSAQEVRSGASVNLSSALRAVSENEFEFTIGIPEAFDVADSTQSNQSARGTLAVFRVMQSGNIASVHVTSADPVSQGRDYIEGSKDHSTKASGSVRVLTAVSSERYSGEFSAIKGRGNTSWNAAKKSYQVKLNKKADLLDAANHEGATEKAKKWLLIANPFDPTLMRNEMTYQLAKDIGLEATVDAEAVDLYYDGEYRGSYLLTEKVEIGDGRVEINDLESDIEDANSGVDFESLRTVSASTTYGSPMQYVAGVRDPADITGGYILELDDAFYASEKSWFDTQTSHTFVSKSPEFLSKRQIDYVSNIMNEAMLCVVYGGVNPYTRKTLFQYFDEGSLVRYFYVNELTKNADQYFSSAFFYIPEGQTKIYAGPIWDCDGTYGIRKDVSGCLDAKGWLGGNSFKELTNCTEFRKALYEAYSTEISGAARSMVYGEVDVAGSIGFYSAKNGSSRLMNEKVWGVATPFVLMIQYSSYDDALAAMRSWIEKRFEWLDAEIMSYAPSSAQDGVPMYRMYNRVSGEHLYTANAFERDELRKGDWNYEGIGWTAPSLGTPVYRLYNPGLGDHHYTTNAGERAVLLRDYGWQDEGIGWYSGGSTPMYRLYNGGLRTGQHHYTASNDERAANIAFHGWTSEDIGWYGL